MITPKQFSLLNSLLVFLITIKLSQQQSQTFYFQDQNIRFYQVTLVPSSPIVANQSVVTFTKPTDFIDNVNNTELALCGFSLENQYNFEYTAAVTYTRGQFTITLQVFNETKIDYISFYVILYTNKAVSYFEARSFCLKCQFLNANPNKNRTELLNITMNTNRTLGSNYYVKPFLRSMKTREGGNGYTRLQMTYSYWDMYTTRLVVMLSTYESLVEEACVTVVALSYQQIGTNYTYYIADMTVREFQAASIKAAPTNFGISSTIYGPIFNKKCLIGFYNLYFRDGVKQIYFDTTKTGGIQSLTQITPQYFYAELSIYCVSKQRTCTTTQGIQTGLQQCVNCSLMIKNCVYCLTQAECTSCSQGYFIDRAKKCCPTYLTNCSVCSQNNVCTQCVDGYFVAESGFCLQCSSAVANCYRCANSTFCYQCNDGFAADNYTVCRAINGSGTNSTTNSTNNSATNSSTNNNNGTNPNNSNTTDSSSEGMPLWMILAISLGSALLLLLLILIIVCFKWKKTKSIQNNHAPVESQRSPISSGNPTDRITSSLNQLPIPFMNQPMKTLHAPTSIQNHKPTTDLISRQPTEQMINESQLQPGSGMDIRFASRFQSYFTNFLNPRSAIIQKQQNPPLPQQMPTKDFNSINSNKQKSTNHKNPNSLISSDMHQSNEPVQLKEMKEQNDLRNGPQMNRNFLKKDISFLPQVSKNTAKHGGSIHLKANYYK